MKNAVNVLAVTVIGTTLVYAHLALGDEMLNTREACEQHLFAAAQELAKKDFILPSRIEIKAANDFECYADTNTESMANVVITLKESGHSYFGIFHSHFVKTGQLRSAASLEDDKWVRFKKDSEWRKPWCEFIRAVYRKAMEEQGCNNYTGSSGLKETL